VVGEGWVRVANTVNSGYTLVLDTATGYARGIVGVPDTGWTLGTVLYYCRAGGNAWVSINATGFGSGIGSGLDSTYADSIDRAVAMADSCVRRDVSVADWERGQQGTDLTFTSSAFAVRETLINLLAMGGHVFLGNIGLATDTFMVYVVHYYTGDTFTATGGTNTGQISIGAGIDSTPAGGGTPSGGAVTLVKAHLLNTLASSGVAQISTYAEYGSDLYGANKVTPKIYAGLTTVSFNYGGSPNADGKLRLKVAGIKVYARWAGLGPMP
jgi:hypothetical protein